AVYIRPLKEFVANRYLNISVSVRDDSEFGGDTAGIPTALRGDVKNLTINDDNEITAGLTNVSGLETIDCYMFVKGTGLRTLDYYDKFDGYYTVTDGAEASISYISTFDGNDSSKLDKDTKFYWNETTNKITDVNTDTTIKDFSNGEADKTSAGIHSGTPYDEFVSGGKVLAANEKAFQYSHTLQIDGDSTKATYVPMSYLALNETLVSAEDGTREVDGVKVPAGTVYYDKNNYISFNVQDASGNYPKYERYTLSRVASAITIYDGKTRYTGTSTNDTAGIKPLTSNPYINVNLFDFENGSLVTNEYRNSPYLNNCLAVTTVGADNVALDYIKNKNDNWNNYVGSNGHLMYLAQQGELQENQFGLILTKKDSRSSVSTLTITIDVATCVRDAECTY
ncbi:MAG: hypothetical protein K2M48_03630, partial [Clostridiales bacterium]|nr:hypothetical protein [Clostridiales bacterium]